MNLRKDHYRLFLALVGESKERMNDFDGSLRQDLLSGTYELPRAAPVCAEGILARSLARSLTLRRRRRRSRVLEPPAVLPALPLCPGPSMAAPGLVLRLRI